MSSNNAANPWFLTRTLNPQAKLNLFCFPYAGGGAQIFHNWQKAFPPSTGVQVWPVQYPGRGSRLREKPFTRCASLVEALAPAVLPLTDRPFALFGHSMGATIAFELARLLREHHGREPAQLFVSGRRAPQVPEEEPATHHLPDPEFIVELRRLNGTPAEVLDHPELMQLMLPVIRADFTLTQTYTYTPAPPLSCPISIFGGLDDQDVTREHLAGWCEQTEGQCSMRMFAGNHFFLQSAEGTILEVVRQELSRLK